jgi:hypothetical protein
MIGFFPLKNDPSVWPPEDINYAVSENTSLGE